MRKLQLFKVKLKDWNKDSFGELNKRKKSILNEIANFDAVKQEEVLTILTFYSKSFKKMGARGINFEGRNSLETKSEGEMG